MLTEDIDNSDSAQRSNQATVLTIAGDVDCNRTSELSSLFAESGDDHSVVVDVSGVTFIDSSGLRLFLDEHRRRDERGHRLVLRSPSSAMLRLLELTKLADVFAIERA